MHGNEKYIKNRLGFIPNFVPLPQNITGKKARRIFHSQFESFSVTDFDHLLQAFHVDHDLELRKMSDGMKKKLLISLVFSYHPSILLADELMNELDQQARKLVIDTIIQRVETEGILAIIASHEEIFEFGDKAKRIQINEGIVQP